jgi:hypothetical protein
MSEMAKTFCESLSFIGSINSENVVEGRRKSPVGMGFGARERGSEGRSGNAIRARVRLG